MEGEGGERGVVRWIGLVDGLGKKSEVIFLERYKVMES